MNLRYNLKDIGQDLTYVDVEVDEEYGIGITTEVPIWCSKPVRDLFLNKAFDKGDNPVGSNFNFADPEFDFKVFKSVWVIESIQSI